MKTKSGRDGDAGGVLVAAGVAGGRAQSAHDEAKLEALKAAARRSMAQRPPPDTTYERATFLVR